VSRYDPLTQSLTDSADDKVELTFEDIDLLVGQLPPSARKHAAWWTNGPSAHQSRYWLAAGRRAKPDFMRGVVRFDRVAGAPKSTKKPWKIAGASVTAPAGVTTRKPVDLTPTGEHLRGTVSYEWQSADEARLRNDKLYMPQLTPRPGIYRFRIEYHVGTISYYVGETENLFRRMGHYCNPEASQQTNVRINALLAGALRDGGRVKVEVVTAALSNGESLDLALKWPRRLVENMAVVELLRIRADVENR
jgi:hypothetical protein